MCVCVCVCVLLYTYIPMHLCDKQVLLNGGWVGGWEKSSGECDTLLAILIIHD